MEIGDIVIWKNYPFPHTGKIKDRWFLFLGTYKEDPFSQDIILLMPTATTQVTDFEPGGRRCRHSFLPFYVDEGFGFVRDCIIDFDEVFYNISRKQFDPYQKDIVIMGDIRGSKKKQHDVCTAVQSAHDIDRIIKNQVRENLRSIGAFN